MLPWDRVQDRIVETTRRRFPDRRVRRRVQGVTLTLPWSHRLPDYAVQFPLYGQNLVAVARAVEDAAGPRFTMVDVGANVGDSALQVLNVVDAEVVCVEGDPYWLTYLASNTAGEPRVHIKAAVLLPDGVHMKLAPVRQSGTTRLVPDAGEHDGLAPGVTVAGLRDFTRALPPVRLVKVDTDGYDARLVPGLARVFSDTFPVVFFEFDPVLAAETGDGDPDAVWAALDKSGYGRALVWDNFGNHLGAFGIRELEDAARILASPVEARGYHYWDVAVIHREDPHNSQIESALCP